MEWETSRILTKILGRRELDKVPPDTAKKIEKYFEDRFEEFLQQQALNETNARAARKLKLISDFCFLLLLLFSALICDFVVGYSIFDGCLSVMHMLCPKFAVVLVHRVYALRYLSAKNR